MTSRIPVFYRAEQSCTEAASYSPSAEKPALVVADWLERFGEHIAIHSFEPATKEQLYAAHDRKYVDGILNGKIANGFGNASIALADSLLYTTGSMLAAAQHVLTTQDSIAASPTSGFHHARFAAAEGFCTFNGLIITAMEMYRLGLAKRILILDCDQHYGDGTDDIIEQKHLYYITNITAGKSYHSAEELFAVISTVSKQFDLVLFQTGADMHVDDPLGGRLNTNQMQKRDRIVFGACHAASVPVVFNLAGGYQHDSNGGIEPVLELHRNTLRMAIRQIECL